MTNHRSILLLHSVCSDDYQYNEAATEDNSINNGKTNTTAEISSKSKKEGMNWAWQDLKSTSSLICNLFILPEIPPDSNKSSNSTSTRTADASTFREHRHHQQQQQQQQQQNAVMFHSLRLNPCGIDNVLLLNDFETIKLSQKFLLSAINCRLEQQQNENSSVPPAVTMPSLPVEPTPSTFVFSFQSQHDTAEFVFYYDHGGRGDGSKENGRGAISSSFADISLTFDVSEGYRAFYDYRYKQERQRERKRGFPSLATSDTPIATTPNTTSYSYNDSLNNSKEWLQDNAANPDFEDNLYRDSALPLHHQHRTNHPYNSQSLLEEMHTMVLREEELLTTVSHGMLLVGFVLVGTFVRVLERVRQSLCIVELEFSRKPEECMAAHAEAAICVPLTIVSSSKNTSLQSAEFQETTETVCSKSISGELLQSKHQHIPSFQMLDAAHQTRTTQECLTVENTVVSSSEINAASKPVSLSQKTPLVSTRARQQFVLNTTSGGELPKLSAENASSSRVSVSTAQYQEELSPCSKLAKEWEATKSTRRCNYKNKKCATAMASRTVSKSVDASTQHLSRPTEFFSSFSSTPVMSVSTKPTVAAKKSSKSHKETKKSSQHPLFLSPYLLPIELPSSSSSRGNKSVCPITLSTKASSSETSCQAEDFW